MSSALLSDATLEVLCDWGVRTVLRAGWPVSPDPRLEAFAALDTITLLERRHSYIDPSQPATALTTVTGDATDTRAMASAATEWAGVLRLVAEGEATFVPWLARHAPDVAPYSALDPVARCGLTLIADGMDPHDAVIAAVAVAA